jgi:hypothetical protein
MWTHIPMVGLGFAAGSAGFQPADVRASRALTSGQARPHFSPAHPRRRRGTPPHRPARRQRYYRTPSSTEA